jgi:hypothetical protein
VRETAGSSLSPTRVLTFPAPEGDALLSGMLALLPRFERREAA